MITAGVEDGSIEESLKWTAVAPESAPVVESGTELVQTARTLYKKGLQLYVGGDNVAAEQALTDAGLAVDIASESDLTEAEEEELGLLQEKIAFFLDQLAPEGSAGEMAGGATEGDASPAEVRAEARADLLATSPDAEVTRLPEIEIVMNDRVQKWINFFTGRGRDKFQLWLERTGRYKEVIYPILEEEGLPRDLIYLSLIESGMNPTAVSWAKAEGMWQFIKSTARLYNVKMDWWVDERRDPVKSCRAAAQHLRDLHEMFDDWLLAMAAYNSGAGRVQREIQRCKTRNYWDLRLPTQTKDYVPQFMAAAIIGRNPEKYGFDPQYQDPLEFDMVEVEGPLSLAAVARCAGVGTDVLVELNPKLRQKAVPPYPKPYLLRVPPGTGEACQIEIARMDAGERAKFAISEPSRAVASADRHKVKRGETLSGIAKRYGTSVAALARVNGLRETSVIRVGANLKLPESASNRHDAERYRTREVPAGTTYTVRRGDTPASIAARFGIPVNTLLARNDLSSRSRIYPGDELVVSEKPADTVVASADAAPKTAAKPADAKATAGKGAKTTAQAAAKPAARSYVVKRGDTLYDIARRFGTTTRAIELANGLHRNELIRAGDRLVIPAKGAAATELARKGGAKTTVKGSDADAADAAPEVAMAEPPTKLVVYTVKRGDTLGSIATKFGVALSSLRHWNEIAARSSRIQAGQKLKVYVPQKQTG